LEAFVTDFWLKLAAAVAKSGDAPVFGIWRPLFFLSKEKAETQFVPRPAKRATAGSNRHDCDLIVQNYYLVVLLEVYWLQNGYY
jgi:hypothetical protein